MTTQSIYTASHETRARRAPHLPVAALGWSAGLFLAVTYAVCVAFDLIFPSQSMNGAWASVLPWVSGISVGGVLLGLVETFLYGWFFALIFGPLFNYFAARSAG